jgi:hypothetical protein
VFLSMVVKPTCKNRTRSTLKCRRACCRKIATDHSIKGTEQLGFNRNCPFGVCEIVPGKVNSICRCEKRF